jgi:zinc protease
MKTLSRTAEFRRGKRASAAAAWQAVFLLCLSGLLGEILPSAIAQAARTAEALPDRPEKLSFKPLQYEPPHPNEYRVPLKSGPVAYVIPDRELPLVNLVLYVRTGGYVVPKGKEGLHDLTGYLLARGGTQSKSAEELEESLDFLAAHLNSGIGDTHGTISLNLLAKDLDQGLQILREVLTAPRFQEDKLALRKQQIVQQLKQRNDDSADIEARERRFLAYGEDFWVNRLPTGASIEGLSRANVQEFHKKWFHPTNFIVAVNGDFDRAEMTRKLERLLGDWPFQGESAPPIPTNTTFTAPGLFVVNKDVNQGRVSMILPGIHRDNPDYYAITVMNDILGGGGFTSRIMNRVRSDEGLAYAAGSSFGGGVYFPGTFMVGFQSKSRTVAYAISIVLEEIRKIASEQVTDEELETAKKGIIESFPRTFTTKSEIANVLAQDELTGRYRKDPDYWKNYRARIASANKDDVQRVARKYLQPDKLAVIVVGQRNDILQGHPDHSVAVESLTRGRTVELPLRDPLTLKPVTN